MKTEVLLIDQSDGPGGSATVYPRNRIVINMSFQPGFVAGKWPDWLSYVFTHEYTHIVQLDDQHAWFTPLFRLFGFSNPFNALASRWYVEGLATMSESKWMPGGRAYEPYSNLVLGQAACATDNLRYDQTFYDDGAIWPDVNMRAYALGSRWLNDIANEPSSDYFSQLMLNNAHAVGLHWPWDKDAEEQLQQSFTDFMSRMPTPATSTDTPTQFRLTQDGFDKHQLFVDRDYVYTVAGAYDRDTAALVRYKRKTGEQQRLFSLYGVNFSMNTHGQLVCEQFHYPNQFNNHSDIAFTDKLEKDRRVLLTQDERALYPAIAPDGLRVAYIKQNGLLTQVRVLDRVSGTLRELTPPSSNIRFGALAWSPDGQWIAAELWYAGGAQNIVLLSPSGDAQQRLYSDVSQATESAPAFDPRGDYVYFHGDNGGQFQIYRYNFMAHSVEQMTHVSSGAMYPAISPENTELYYLTATPHGFEIESQHLEDIQAAIKFLGFDLDRPSSADYLIDRPLTEYPVSGMVTVTDYALGKSLSPSIYPSGLGLNILGSDATERHVYTGSVGIDYTLGDLGYSFSYQCDIFKPTLAFSATQYGTTYTSLGGTYIQKNNHWNLSSTWVLPTFRSPNTFLSFGLGFDSLSLAKSSASTGLLLSPTLGTYQGLQTQVILSNALGYGNSVGYEKGLVLSSLGTLYDTALGSVANYAIWQNGADYYQALPWPHHVLHGGLTQLKFSGAIPLQDDGTYTIPGYPSGYLASNSPLAAQLSYSFPLLEAHRGTPQWDLYLRKLNLNLRYLKGFSTTITGQSLQATLTAAMESKFIGNYYLDLAIAQGLDTRGELQANFGLRFAGL